MIKMSGLRKNLADLVRFEFGIDQIRRLRENFDIMAIPNFVTRGYLLISEVNHLLDTIPQRLAEGGYVSAVIEGSLIIAPYEFGKYIFNLFYNYIGRESSSELTIMETTRS